MPEPYDLLLPPGVGAGTAVLLVVVSFCTSALTAGAGIGGGVVQLSVLAALLPPATVLPVHGIVQLGSNVSRAVLLRDHACRPAFGFFALGATLGTLAAAPLVVTLPIPVLQAVIGAFVLYSVWAPRLRPSDVPVSGYLPVGAVTTFLTFFVGATGVFVAAFHSTSRLGRRGVVATHAACMTLQHGVKIVVFGVLGFAYLPWAALVTAMLVSGLAGTVAGTRLLERVSERRFATVFRLVLTVLALRLLWSATETWR